jgi:hypothetical protein
VWNWKTALCSGLYRAPAFLAVSLRAGAEAAGRAAAAEFLLFAAVSGFAGAVTQRLCRLRPWWHALFWLLGVLPLCVHTAEWAVHSALQTPGRRRGLILSIAMTLIAEAFNWFVMRGGLFHAGPGASPLLDDLRRLPRLLLRARPD